MENTKWKGRFPGLIDCTTTGKIWENNSFYKMLSIWTAIPKSKHFSIGEFLFFKNLNNLTVRVAAEKEPSRKTHE